MDFPRFFVPAWGPTPIPAGAPIDPALNHTNGYGNSQGMPASFLSFFQNQQW
jgi:hypothetical protein